MSKQSEIKNTNSWVLFTWFSFMVALVAMSFAVIYMPVDHWLKAYLGLSSLFLVQASISLSKTIRDQAELQSKPIE